MIIGKCSALFGTKLIHQNNYTTGFFGKMTEKIRNYAKHNRTFLGVLHINYIAIFIGKWVNLCPLETAQIENKFIKDG